MKATAAVRLSALLGVDWSCELCNMAQANDSVYTLTRPGNPATDAQILTATTGMGNLVAQSNHILVVSLGLSPPYHDVVNQLFVNWIMLLHMVGDGALSSGGSHLICRLSASKEAVVPLESLSQSSLMHFRSCSCGT